MFGYNAGGGAYLPRQGSFMIQCDDTFIGLTGPGVVKSVARRGRHAPTTLGGPGVHGLNGVVRPHHRRRARLAAHGDPPARLPARQQPPSSRRSAPTSDPIDRFTLEEDILFRQAPSTRPPA